MLTILVSNRVNFAWNHSLFQTRLNIRQDRVRTGHGKPGKSSVEFYNFIFQAWKVLKFRCGSWKVMENQYDFYE